MIMSPSGGNIMQDLSQIRFQTCITLKHKKVITNLKRYWEKEKKLSFHVLVNTVEFTFHGTPGATGGNELATAGATQMARLYPYVIN